MTQRIGAIPAGNSLLTGAAQPPTLPEMSAAVPNSSSSQPRAPGAAPPVTIVSLAAVTWDFQLVGRTRMLTEAWLADGQPTVFVQIPSYRTALERLTRFARARPPLPVVRPWPTTPASRWGRIRVELLERRIARRAAALRRELDPLVDWRRAVAMVVTPTWTPWLRELPFAAVVYDCIDDLAVHVSRRELTALYRQWEDELIERADAAIVTAKGLADGVRARRGDLAVKLVRNGVDAERFERAAASSRRPGDVPRGRPVVGFVGALYGWIDWELIERVVALLPGANFVFVGPHDGNPGMKRVASRRNARFLGPRPYVQVPAYVASFDVCWVPFKQDAVAFAANPVKIYEYLALAKPVVSTPVADTESFGGLIACGRDAPEIAGAIRAALEFHDPTIGRQRVAFARENTWKARAEEIARFVTDLV